MEQEAVTIKEDALCVANAFRQIHKEMIEIEAILQRGKLLTECELNNDGKASILPSLCGAKWLSWCVSPVLSATPRPCAFGKH